LSSGLHGVLHHSGGPRLHLPTAFFSVCLAVLQLDPVVQRDVETTVEKFLTSVAWRPTVVKSAAGTVLYTRYGWLKRWLMRRIVRKAGGGTDTSRDYEYTDWTDLERFAERFAALVASRVSPRAVSQAGLRDAHDLVADSDRANPRSCAGVGGDGKRHRLVS
jgi:hypothetical protein